jgi:hypothetical protein
MFHRAALRITVAGLVAVAATLVTGFASAGASPPTHEKVVEKDVAVTIDPLTQCPAGDAVAIDLVFHDVLTGRFTDATFHVNETLTGTFVARSASGAALSSGHFTSTSSNQGPGFPTLVVTNVINVNGHATDGTHLHFHIIEHLTITANGDITSEFMTASCA